MMPYRSLRCSIARHGQPRTDTLAIRRPACSQFGRSGNREQPPVGSFVASSRRAAPVAREGPCHSCPMAAPKSTLAVRARAVQSAPAALEAMSGSAASPPCAPDRHSCAPKRPPALDGIGHRLRHDTRRSHREHACTRLCSLTPCGNGRRNSSSALNGRLSSRKCIQEGIQGEVVLAGHRCGGRFLVLPKAVGTGKSPQSTRWQTRQAKQHTISAQSPGTSESVWT